MKRGWVFTTTVFQKPLLRTEGLRFTNRRFCPEIAANCESQDSHGGGVPFLFYNLIEGPYDPTGNSTQGRYTVVFRGGWSQSAGLARTDVAQIELIEVA